MATNKTRDNMRYITYSLVLVMLIHCNFIKADSTNHSSVFSEFNTLAVCDGAGTITASSGPIACANTPITLTITGYNNTIVGWMISTDFGFSDLLTTTTLTNSNTFTLPNGITQNTYVKVIFVSTNTVTCANLFSSTLSIGVNTPISNNSITSSVTSFGCTFTSNIVITGPTAPSTAGNVFYVWQMSADAQNWTTVASGVSASTLTMNQYPAQSVYFRRVINTPSCGISTSNTVFIQFISNSIGGIVSGGGNYCSDQEIITLSLTGHSGAIIQWEKSLNGTNFTSIGQTAQTSIVIDNLMATSYYRAVVQSDGCEIAYSSTAMVNIGQPIENNILLGNQIVCEGQIPQPIIGSIHIGGTNGVSASILWQQQEEGSDEWVNIPVSEIVNETLVFTEPIVVTTHFRRIISDEECDFSISEIVTLELVEDIETYTTVGICDGETYVLPNGVATDVAGNYPFTYSSLTTGCDSTSIIHVEVYTPVSNNTISSNQWICPGNSPQPITGSIPAGGSGNYSFQWQYSFDQLNWNNVESAGNSMNYILTTFNQTTYLRRKVTTDACPFSISNIVTIELVSEPTGYLSSTNNNCPGAENEITFNLTGTPPFEIYYSDGTEFYTLENINTNVFTITYSATSDALFTLLGLSDMHCTASNFETSSVLITVLPDLPEVNAGMDAFVCGLNHTINGTDPGDPAFNAQWTDLDGTLLSDSNTLNTSVLTSGVYGYLYTISNNTCGISLTDTVWVTYDLPQTSNAGPNQLVCNNTTQMQANEIENGQGFWIIPSGLTASNPFDPNAFISGLQSGESYNLHWVTMGEFAVCNSDTSTVTITVQENSYAGLLTTSNLTVCEGSQVEVSAQDYTGSIIGWIISNEDASETQNSDESTIAINNITQNTFVQVIVQSGTCAPDTSAVLSIEVNPTTIAGVLGSNQTFCSTDNLGDIQLSNMQGDILYWESSTDNFNTIEQINSNLETYTFENLQISTQFRVKVQSGICQPQYSNIVSIEIGNLVDLSFDVNPTYCSTDNTVVLGSLIENVPSATWFLNGSAATTFNPANYTGSEVEISVSFGEGECVSQNSETVFVYQSPIANAGPNMDVCGTEVVLSASPTNGVGQWTMGDEIILLGDASNPNLSILSLAYGTHILTWTETIGQCVSSSTVEVSFWEEPSEAEAGPDQHLSYTSETSINAVLPEVGTGFWSAENSSLVFDDAQSTETNVINLQIGENIIFWNVSNGSCVTERSELLVYVNPLVIPNGFTPNGDNINDIFEIEGIHMISPVQLTIVNRWGEKVYESEDYNNEWTGLHKNGNELPSDTYYYSLNAMGVKNGMSGFIVLKR